MQDFCQESTLLLLLSRCIHISHFCFFNETVSLFTKSQGLVFAIGTIHLRCRHVLGGEGGLPLPTFADARGGGV